ncbi:MAG: VOC family protein [Pseudomonadota bacterium]
MVKELLHVGIGVRDIEESARFYTEIMGMVEEYRTRNVGEKISQIVGVANADIDVCVVQKNNLRIELLDYKNDDLKRQEIHKRQDELGLIHLAFSVDDVEKEYQRIKALGFEFNAPPMVARENGPKITYFRGPDNVIIEIFEKVN